MGTKITLNYDYEKLKTAMRYWLLGQEYLLAYKAMELGLRNHVGERKDGAPEFSHQIFQASFARTLLSSFMYPEETLATIFLHDVVEDCAFPIADIYDGFGPEIGDAVELMTNIHSYDLEDRPRGQKKHTDTYYGNMSINPIASIAKGIDRMHNHQSMHGVFSDEKKQRYIDETGQHIIPMMKEARNRFPSQEPAYQNVKHCLLTQIELIELMLNK